MAGPCDMISRLNLRDFSVISSPLLPCFFFAVLEISLLEIISFVQNVTLSQRLVL